MSREWHFWVYILASKSRRIYTGVTKDIERRVREHKRGEIEGFTQRYKINRLVYCERFHYVGNASLVMTISTARSASPESEELLSKKK